VRVISFLFVNLSGGFAMTFVYSVLLTQLNIFQMLIQSFRIFYAISYYFPVKSKLRVLTKPKGSLIMFHLYVL